MTWTRRAFVVRAAKAVALLPSGALVGCTGQQSAAGETGTSGGSSSGSVGSSSTGEPGGSTTDLRGTTSGSESSSGGAGSSTSEGSSGSTGTDAESSSSSSTGASACELTPEDIEGPFYRPGIPIGGNLDTHGDAGVPLRLEGRVLDEACEPLAAAVVEIWHATPVAPGGEPGDVNAVYDASDAYRYYGQVATDAQGRFAFDTLRPGWYLNGPAYRPAHVHVKVWVRDVERLTSQIYFEGDPFNEDDNWFNPDMAVAPDRRGLAVLDLIV